MAATKRIRPTVLPKAVAAAEEIKRLPGPKVVDESAQGVKEAREAEEAEQGLNLPPISHIKPPEMRHTSTKIRWYLGLGYTVKEVSGFLGVRYQQVRNVATVEPKRAAREDVPPYIIECWEIADDLEAMADHALDQQMAAQRAQDRENKKRARKGLPKLDEPEWAWPEEKEA